MKKSLLLLALLLCGLSAAHATVAPVSANAHVCSATPSTNFGNRSNLEVSSSCTAYLSFALKLPSGTTSAQVSKATMFVYVNRVYTTGTMSAAALSTAFTEGNVTYNTKPTAGTAFTTAPVNTGGAYVAVDVTLTVQGWVSGTTNNTSAFPLRTDR